MELLLTDEQRLLQESAQKLVERGAGPKRARKLRDTPTNMDAATWREIAEAGWLALAVPAAADGLDLGMTELCLVLEQAGRGLVTEPLTAVAMTARAIAEGESDALRKTVLAEMMAGKRIVLPALQEGPFGVELDKTKTTAAADGTGVRLSGRKSFIADAAGADGFVVSARGPNGLVLCYVPKNAAGAGLAVKKQVDGGALGTLTLTNVVVPKENVLAGPNHAPVIGQRLADGVLIGAGAELLGVMGQALDTTVEYLKIRKQFDRPIGSFQALQHRAVNEYIEVELTRSLVFQVCTAVDAGRGSPMMASAVKAKASGAALQVCKSSIQMHGAIGFTDEHDIGLYLKRAMALSASGGNEAAHRQRYARLSGIEPAA
ncbi:MAG: acyl-CoA dehydrogenase [Alphaproteobacteria bacterium]|nr:acyl-CoA dehydrogenase [Alphaproteobacteria bacterium]